MKRGEREGEGKMSKRKSNQRRQLNFHMAEKLQEKPQGKDKARDRE